MTQARRARGFSVGQICRRLTSTGCPITTRHYYSYELGNTNIPMKKLESIASLLGIADPSSLLDTVEEHGKYAFAAWGKKIAKKELEYFVSLLHAGEYAQYWIPGLEKEIIRLDAPSVEGGKGGLNLAEAIGNCIPHLVTKNERMLGLDANARQGVLVSSPALMAEIGIDLFGARCRLTNQLIAFVRPGQRGEMYRLRVMQALGGAILLSYLNPAGDRTVLRGAEKRIINRTIEG